MILFANLAACIGFALIDGPLWCFLLYPVPSEPFPVSEAAPQNGARERSTLEEVSPTFCSDDGRTWKIRSLNEIRGNMYLLEEA